MTTVKGTVRGNVNKWLGPVTTEPDALFSAESAYASIAGNFAAASSQYLSGSLPAVTHKLWSFTGWFLKSSASAGVQRIISHFRSSTPVVWEIKVDHAERFAVYTRDDAGTVVSILLGTITLDQWYHFAVVRDDNTLLYYLNGELKSSATGTQGTFTPTYFQIGQQWDGLLNNLAVYDYALSAEQVSALYNSNAGVAFEDFGGVLDTLPVHGWLGDSLTQDYFGTNHLTNNNGVTIAPSKVVAVENDPIVLLEDLSGNGNHLTQTSLAARPLRSTFAQQPALVFSANDETNRAFTFEQEYTIIALAQATDTSGTEGIVDGDAHPAHRQFQLRFNGANVEFLPFNSAGSSFTVTKTGVTITQPNLIVAQVKGDKAFLWCNGGTPATATITGTPASGTGKLTLGLIANNGSTLYLNGKIGKVLFKNYAMPLNQIRDVCKEWAAVGGVNFAPESYFLDEYPGAIGAYSLRQLSYHADKALRVRRSSDNAEQDIGFVNGELDTTTLLSFCGAGDGFVRTWYDQSGNGNHFEQSTQGSQPKVVSSGLYNREIVFNGSLLATTNSGFTLNGSKDYVALVNVRFASTTGSIAVLSSDINSIFLTDAAMHIGYQDTVGVGVRFVTQYGGYNALSNFTTVSPNNYTLLSAEWSAVTGRKRLRLNNVIRASVTVTNTAFQSEENLYLGQHNGVSSLNGAVTDLLFFQQDLQEKHKTAVLNYMSPLLDKVSGAVAGYSLRKLRSAYSGPVIRVRRSSDNTEQDIGFVGDYLDVATLLSFCGAGNGYVHTWYDQIGSGNAVQTTTTLQPQIVANGAMYSVGGVNAVSFNPAGNTQQLPIGDQSALFPTAGAIYSVQYYTNLGNVYNSSATNAWWHYSGNIGYMGVFRSSRLTNYPTNTLPLQNVWTQSTVLSNAEIYEQFYNAVSMGAVAGNFNAGNDHRLGGDAANAASCMRGYISEIVLLNNTLADNKSIIETSQMSYYNIN